MSTDSHDFLDAALSLPDQDRASLAYRLLQSLKPPELISDGHANFEAELQRRVEDYDAGRTSASDWDEVATRLRAKLRERNSS